MEPPRTSKAKQRFKWELWRPLLMILIMGTTVTTSAFIQSWLDPAEAADDQQSSPGGYPTLESFLRYGSIPVVAAVIGYSTNVVALLMMFYPLEFFGFFPQAKIGCGLDLPLFGWQGVIPMKARQMAEISVDIMTEKLIKVEEVFCRLDPQGVAKEVADILPEVISQVVDEAGRRNCPKLWEYLPASVRSQIEERVIQESGPMMSGFISDLQRNIAAVFDLKHCVVERMVNNPRILNEMFLTCGKEEFEFIRNSGFYLGFFFGVLQMIVWMFIKDWWILPLCGVFVGYFTNVVALKAEVSALYAKMVSSKVLHADVLMHALVNGPHAEKMYALVDKHVAKSMEDQAYYYKPMFLMSIGAETWVDFRSGMCAEFRKKLPVLLHRIANYTQESLQLEDTLRERMEKLPAPEFERLLHAVFEQDEIKLILVGAILGAIVGFLQAMVQTPSQLGLSFPW